MLKLPKMKQVLDKFGTAGAIVAAAACPICFPKLAILGGLLGFGAFAPFERYVADIIQVLVIITVIGQALAFRRHRNPYLLALAVVSAVCVFAAYHYFFEQMEWLVYAGLAGFVIASVWLVFENRKCSACESGSVAAEPSHPAP